MLDSITDTIYYNMGSAKLVTAAAVENKRTWSLLSGVLQFSGMGRKRKR